MKANPESASGGTVFSVVIFLSSASIGAGILGLPVQTGLAGIFPALIAMLIVLFIMIMSAYFIADIYFDCDSYDSDIPDLLERPLGKFGKVFGSIGYLLNAYGILIAYIAASGSVLQALFGTEYFHVWFFSLCFLVPAVIATLAGPKIVTKANGIIMFFLFCSFVVLLWFAFSHSKPVRWTFTNWKYAPACFPIILTAFVIHNLVPSVCRYLKRDRKAVRKAIFWGMMIPFIVNFLWMIGVIGALPLLHGPYSIHAAYEAGNPATVPLEKLTSSQLVATAGMLFSITAIFTSFTAIGVGLKAFYKDLLKIPDTKKGFLVSSVVVFLPPILIVFIYPSIFLTALDLVGGIAVSLVYGVLPCLIMIKVSKNSHIKKLAWGLLLVFITIMLLEIGKESGLLHF
jgi:tyrosine-specific transport protein